MKSLSSVAKSIVDGEARSTIKKLIASAGMAFLTVFTTTPFASAQCPDHWYAESGVSGGVNPVIFAMTMWDPDGGGPQAPVLVAGGEFSMAGSTPANNIAMWDGATWSTFGTGMNGLINALAILPSGDLVAAGNFTSANDVPVNYIARWTGTTWAPLGTGMNNQVNCLTIMQNGDLVAGGFFTTADGVTVNRIARWNGTAWSSFGTGIGNIVYDVCVMPNGDLIACGMFTTAGGTLVNRIARWNGTAWSGMNGGANSNVFSLAVTPAGDLVVGGQFTFIGGTGANRIAMRNSATGLWTPLGGGINGTVWELAFLANGDIVAAGQFVTPANFIARWADNIWNPMEAGMDAGVLALLVRPEGLLAGGEFVVAGGTASSCLARWGHAHPPVVIEQPISVSTCASDSALFTVTSGGSGPITYAWEAELDPGTWTTIENGSLMHGDILLGTATGGDTESLLLEGLSHFPEDRTTLNLRCNVKDPCGNTPSEIVTLTVWPVGTGDANGDGNSDGQDVSSFVEMITRGGVVSEGWCAIDFTSDGLLTIEDTAGFVDRLLSM